MASVAAGEEIHQLIRIFSSDIRNLPIVRGIGDFFCNLFNCGPQSHHWERSDAHSPSMVENLVIPAEEEVNVGNIFPKQKEYGDYEDERDPRAVFNVLDMVLVETMERLKKLREGFSVLGKCSFNQGIASVLRNGLRLVSESDGALIRSLCAMGKVKAAMVIHRRLLENHMVLDLYTHNFLMNGLCKIGNLMAATCLLERMAVVGVSPSIVTYNTLVEGYCRWGKIDMALDLVSSMSQSGVSPNVVTCNILVHALCLSGLNVENLLSEILEEHHNDSNVITSTILMNGCCRQGDVAQALRFWNEMIDKHMQIDLIAFNVIINGFCLVHDMKVAYSRFSEMIKGGFHPDVVTYNTLISGFARKGNMYDACDVLSRMELAGLRPDSISYKLVIRGLCQQGNVSKAVRFLNKMLSDQLAPDLHIWNPIINAYGRYSDDPTDACSIRDMMVAMGVVPNVFTYNALIHAHVKHGNMNQAMLLKKEMLAAGILPDAVTYNLLIRGAFNSEFFVRPLIPETWKRVFQPDIFTYTEWIRGLCVKRRMWEAKAVFSKFLLSGMPIDHVPFQILIKAFCKRGKMEEALEIYEKMMKKRLVGHYSLYRTLFIALRRTRYYTDVSAT